MKKLLTSIVTFSLVVSTAVAVSAAPNVNGEVSYKMGLTGSIQDNASFEGKINFDGQLDKNLDYHLQLKRGMDQTDNLGNTTDSISLHEASFTYKNKLADIQVGQFEYNPSVMTIMDSSTQEMLAPVAIKVMPKVGENINLAIGYQPKADSDFNAGAYQVEADYNFGIASVGVNYQKNEANPEDSLVWQVTAQPTKNVNVYGEYGKDFNDNDVAKVGASVNVNKAYVRGEYDMEAADNQSAWATRLGYNFTNNLSTELRTFGESEDKSVDTTNQIRVKYSF